METATGGYSVRTRAISVFSMFFVLFLSAGAGCGRQAVEPGEPMDLGQSDQVPSLVMVIDGDSVPLFCGAYRWPDPGSPEPRCMAGVWPPYTGTSPVAVPLGEEISFRLEGIEAEPSGVVVELWEYPLPSGEPGEPVNSQGIEALIAGASSVSFSWGFPDPLVPGEVPHYVLHVLAKWYSPEPAEVSYYCLIRPADGEALAEVKKTSERFFQACWTGDKDTANSLLAPGERGAQGVHETYSSPLSVRHNSPWDLVLWQSPDYSYALDGEPRVLVRHLGWGHEGPFAEVEIRFGVNASRLGSGEMMHWDFVERHNLEVCGESWGVFHMHRSGTPLEAFGGTEPGWGVAVTTEGSVMKTGPFTGVNPWFGQGWSDDGEVFGFVAENFGRKEIWAVRRDGSGLRRLLSVDAVWGEGFLRDAYLVDWAKASHRLRFMLNGYHTGRPYPEGTGFWVGEADYDTGKVRDIAFIPAARPELVRGIAVTQDRTNLLLRRTPDLWRVDLESGEVRHLAAGLPSWDGLFTLHYSPSGWYGAYGLDKRDIVVLDLHDGVEARFEAGESGCALFSGWVPGEMIAVSISNPEEQIQGEDIVRPAGSVALRFYEPGGHLGMEVTPPSMDPADRIGLWAWSQDGEALAFATGPTGIEATSMQAGVPIHEARDLWVWRGPGSEPELVASLSGPLDDLAWIDGQTLAAWYRPSDDEGVTQQSGLRVSLDGQTSALRRPIPWRAHGTPIDLGTVGNVTYRSVTDDRGTSIVATGGEQGQVVLQGGFSPGFPSVNGESGVLTLIGDTANWEPYPLKIYLYVIDPEG